MSWLAQFVIGEWAGLILIIGLAIWLGTRRMG